MYEWELVERLSSDVHFSSYYEFDTLVARWSNITFDITEEEDSYITVRVRSKESGREWLAYINKQ